MLAEKKLIQKQFKKAYLPRPNQILHFLTPARIQKCLTWLLLKPGPGPLKTWTQKNLDSEKLGP